MELINAEPKHGSAIRVWYVLDTFTLTRGQGTNVFHSVQVDDMFSRFARPKTFSVVQGKENPGGLYCRENDPTKRTNLR